MVASSIVCDDHKDKSKKDNGYQIVLLAKNKKGYHNLAKMSSIAYTEGFYYVPRIDKKVIQAIQRRHYCTYQEIYTEKFRVKF